MNGRLHAVMGTTSKTVPLRPSAQLVAKRVWVRLVLFRELFMLVVTLLDFETALPWKAAALSRVVTTAAPTPSKLADHQAHLDAGGLRQVACGRIA